MSSPTDGRRGSQTPRVANYPEYATSAAPEFIDLAESAGLTLDPWQRYVLTHGLGETNRGKWSALKCSLWVPRQNGKGAVIEALSLGWLFLTREPLILHSAHEYKTAQEGFLRIKQLISETPDLDRRVNRYWQANGEQGIELTRAAGGGRLRFIARSRGSGRGFTGHKHILDEAQEIVQAQMAALLPTLAAVPNPQVWFFGTPPDDPAAWAYGLRADGEAGVPRLAHFDWGTDLDPTDPDHQKRAARDADLWYACNPAMGIRISEDFVSDEAAPSGLGDRFMIERLGAWLPEATSESGVIDLEQWGALADRDSRRTGAVAFAVDITPSRDFASIAAYGLRADGHGHAEVIDHRAGTDWLVERLATLPERWQPVAIGLDAKGPASTLLVDLAKRGIAPPADSSEPEWGHLAVPTAQDVAAGCGQLVDAVTQGTIRHIGQELLENAIRGAKTRPLGDAYAWARRLSTVDISPLVSVTLARWAFESRAHLIANNEYDVRDSVL